MNPSSGQPNFGQNFNQGPSPDFSGDLNGNSDANVWSDIPEVAPIGNIEQLSNPEQQIGPSQGIQPVQQVQPVVQPPVVVQEDTVLPVKTATLTNPESAKHDDKIEQEWVDTAKKVISATKNDPHAQASAVADLMRDYIQKRYGKEVGKAPDS